MSSSTSKDSQLAERRLRVLLVHKAMGWGGAEALILNTARLISKDKFDLTCVYIQVDDEDYVEQLEAAGVHCIDLSSRAGGLIGKLAAVIPIVRKGGWDVVHCHSPLPGSIARLATVGLRRRPVMMTTEHSTWGLFNRYTRVLNALSMRRDDAVLAVSQEAHLSMSPTVRARSQVVTHGVLVGELRARAEAARSNQAKAQLTLINVANLREPKDQLTLLHAFRQVIDHGVDCRLRLVGDGPDREVLEREIENLKLGGNVEMMGRRADAAELMATSHLFVLSSVKEGLPVAIMEALAVGLPVVTTAVGGIPEALEGTGAASLVPPRNPAALADAIESVLRDDGLRNAMADAALRASDQFDLRPVVKALEAQYSELVGNRGHD